MFSKSKNRSQIPFIFFLLLLFSNIYAKVFGLGNKTYEQYNAVGRYMDAKMTAVGAKKFFERGEGDDDCSLEVCSS